MSPSGSFTVGSEYDVEDPRIAVRGLLSMPMNFGGPVFGYGSSLSTKENVSRRFGFKLPVSYRL